MILISRAEVTKGGGDLLITPPPSSDPPLIDGINRFDSARWCFSNKISVIVRTPWTTLRRVSRHDKQRTENADKYLVFDCLMKSLTNKIDRLQGTSSTIINLKYVNI